MMKGRVINKKSSGFTLIELLVVVVILGILAAVVVPQLSGSTDSAKVSALDANLARMRTAIDLYKQEHDGYPGVAAATGGTCSVGAAGAGAAGSPAAFASHLTMYSNTTGQTCSGINGSINFGPYLKTAQVGTDGIPNNPMTNSNVVTIVTTGNLTMSSTNTGATKGWIYDSAIGKLIADHQDFDDR